MLCVIKCNLMMQTLLACLLLQLACGTVSYAKHTTLSTSYGRVMVNGDDGFLGFPSGSSPQAFNLVNSSFVQDQDLSSVASGTLADFAKQASKAIIYENPNIKVFSYANNTYSFITSIDLSVFGTPNQIEISSDGRFIFSRHRSVSAIYIFA